MREGGWSQKKPLVKRFGSLEEELCVCLPSEPQLPRIGRAFQEKNNALLSMR